MHSWVWGGDGEGANNAYVVHHVTAVSKWGPLLLVGQESKVLPTNSIVSLVGAA